MAFIGAADGLDLRGDAHHPPIDSAARVGAFAAGSADAALIVNLAPGAYTAQVTGLAGATGTTLLEVSELP